MFESVFKASLELIILFNLDYTTVTTLSPPVSAMPQSPPLTATAAVPTEAQTATATMEMQMIKSLCYSTHTLA